MFKNKILHMLARGVIRLLSATLRFSLQNTEYADEVHKKNQRVIFAFWHGRQFVLVWSHRNRGIAIMTSLSKDGDMQTNILQGFGYNVVRGSSSRGGARAAIAMIHKIEEGHDCAFAVDGPRGPAYEAKPGVVFLAARTNSVIIPVAAAAQRYWHIRNTWDHYVLPKPFSNVAVRYGAPISVSKTDDPETKTRELEEALQQLTEALDNDIEKLKNKN